MNTSARLPQSVSNRDSAARTARCKVKFIDAEGCELGLQASPGVPTSDTCYVNGASGDCVKGAAAPSIPQVEPHGASPITPQQFVGETLSVAFERLEAALTINGYDRRRRGIGGALVAPDADGGSRNYIVSGRASSTDIDTDTGTDTDQDSNCDDGDMVRATGMRHLLAGRGRVFEVSREVTTAASTSRNSVDSNGSRKSPSVSRVGLGVTPRQAEKLYAMSKPATAIDGFISHSWNGSRLRKWLALLHYRHTRLAALCANLFWLVTLLSGFRLRVSAEQLVLPSWAASGIYVCVPLLVFALLFFYAHLLPVPFGRHSARYYLDRLCIHQSEPSLKCRGIASLGAALCASDTLVILLSDDYLSRLWCIFEVATFASHRGTRSIRFVPLWLPQLLLGGLCSTGLFGIIAGVLHSSPLFAHVVRRLGPTFGVGVFCNIAWAVPSAIVCALLRRRMRKHLELEERLRRFKLSSAAVSDEADRPIVEAHIVRLFGSLTALERYVRGDLAAAVVRALGASRMLPYTWVAFMWQPYVWYGAVVAMSIDATEPMRGVLPEPDSSSPGLAYLRSSVMLFFLCGVHALLAFPFALKLLTKYQYHTRGWVRHGWAIDLLLFHAGVLGISASSTYCVQLFVRD